MMNNLILASSSPYRKALLERLGIPFSCISPNIDEQMLEGETPTELVSRLSRLKAEAVAASRVGDWVIGSDQVAELDGRILTKPGTPEAAFAQLKRQSGRTVEFHTGLALINSTKQQKAVDVVTTKVSFRELSDDEIERYLARDKPWDCAGSFKAEGLGITLFSSLSSSDPTALIGLPLIRLAEMLRSEDYKIP